MSSTFLYLISFFLVSAGIIIDYVQDKEKAENKKTKIEFTDSRQDRDLDDLKVWKAESKVRFNILENKLKEYDSEIVGLKTEGDHFQDHLSRVRDSVHDLNDKLSRKRPIIKFPAPVPVEIINDHKKKK